LDSIKIITSILDAAPQVKLLITSRVVPDVPGEHIIQLGGLALPPIHSTDDVESYSCVELFIRSARRIKSKFNLVPANQSAVIQICHLVNGMPLALLLAASWVQILDPDEIAAEISRGFDFLDTDTNNLSPRHSSMRGVLNHSWRLLSKNEQEIIKMLSVFLGGFSAKAAYEIVGASLRDLKNLSEKTFVQRIDGKRYQIHELTRQFLSEKLTASPALEIETRNLHSSYYFQELKRWQIDSKGSRQVAALERIRSDIDNVRSGWDWTVEQQQVDLINQGLDGMCSYYAWLAQFADGKEVCQRTLDHTSTIKSKTALRVSARLLVWKSKFCEAMNQFDRVIPLVVESFELLENPILKNEKMRTEKAFLKTWMGAVGRGERKIESIGNPKDFLDESISVYRQQNMTHDLALALQCLGNYLQIEMEYDQAKQAFEESIALHKANGNDLGATDTLSNLGDLSRLMGNLEEAEKNSIDSVTYSRSLNHPFLLAHALQNLGWNHLWTGKFRDGIIALEESHAIFKNLGIDYRIAFVFLTQALCQVELGHYEKAERMIESIIDEQKGRNLYIYGMCLGTQGMSLFAKGETENAEHFLKESMKCFEKIDLDVEKLIYLSMLGILNIDSGNTQPAQNKILKALQIGEKIGAYYILVHAIPAAAFLIAAQGDVVLGIEIYEAAKQRVFVKNSCWFEDTIECKINVLANDLPPKVVKGAKRRGRVRDEGETIKDLIHILESSLVKA
ncbi:MAG: hypothetical protein ABFS17_12235, partial [Chloroflexota bacterium]